MKCSLIHWKFFFLNCSQYSPKIISWKILISGKARRLKQAKDEAQAEIEKFRQERERQFKEYEAKHLGSQDDIALKIKNDTHIKIDAMNKQVAYNKEAVIKRILQLVNDIRPEMHINAKKEEWRETAFCFSGLDSMISV